MTSCECVRCRALLVSRALWRLAWMGEMEMAGREQPIVSADLCEKWDDGTLDPDVAVAILEQAPRECRWAVEGLEAAREAAQKFDEVRKKVK